MGTSASSTREQLVDCIRRHVPDADSDKEIRLDPIPTGKFNDSFFVYAAGSELVLRVAPPIDSVFCFYERGMMRQEPELHALLLERSGVPVPRIVAHDETHEVLDRDYLIMERLPGTPLSEARSADSDAVFQEVGRHLAEVHSLTGEAYGYVGKHRPMEPQESWSDAFRVMWTSLVEDVVSVGHYDRTESAWLIEIFEDHAALFDRDKPPRLLHMDIWHQNLLVDEEGRLTGIIDWDRALWGDPEIEFAVLDYCGVSVPSFWKGYGDARDMSSGAMIRRVFYLLYELQKYIVIRQGRGHDKESARAYKRQVVEMAQGAFGRWCT